MSEPAVVHCLACGEALLPRLDECFVCPPQPPAPRRAARYRVTAVTSDPVELARGLDALVASAGTGERSARWFLARLPFDVVLEGSELQHELFVGLLGGAKHDVLAADAPPPPDSFRWAGRPVAWKLGATAVIGAGAFALGTTSVLVASAGMATVLAARGARLVPRVLAPAREAVDAQLDILEPGARAAYRAARSALAQPGTRQALDRFVAVVAATRGEARATGAHLRDLDVSRLDVQLGRVTRELCLLLGRSAAPVAAAVAEGYRQNFAAGDRTASTLVAGASRALQEALAAPGGPGAQAALLARYVPAQTLAPPAQGGERRAGAAPGG